MSACADSDTNTKKSKKIPKIKINITCRMSPVTCHQRQHRQPQTLPLLTPPICTVSRLVHKDRTHKPKNFRTQKNCQHLPKKRGHSVTGSLQLSWFRSSREGKTTHPRETDIATHRLNPNRGRCSDNFLKIYT